MPRRFPTRQQLSIVAALAALVAIALMRFDWHLAAGAAAVIAVGCISEAWRRDR